MEMEMHSLPQCLKDLGSASDLRVKSVVRDKLKQYRLRTSTQKLRRFVRTFLGEGLILDVGCGTGVFFKYVTRTERCETVGVDIYFRLEAEPDFFILSDVCHLPLRKSIFDLIVMIHLIEHLSIENGLKALNNIHYALKEGGYVVVGTPNAGNPSKIAKRVLKRIGLYSHVTRALERSRQDSSAAKRWKKALIERPKSIIHEHEYTSKELLKFMTYKFQVVKTGGVTFEWYPFVGILDKVLHQFSWYYIELMLAKIDKFLDKSHLWFLKSSIYVVGRKN